MFDIVHKYTEKVWFRFSLWCILTIFMPRPSERCSSVPPSTVGNAPAGTESVHHFAGTEWRASNCRNGMAWIILRERNGVHPIAGREWRASNYANGMACIQLRERNGVHPIAGTEWRASNRGNGMACIQLRERNGVHPIAGAVPCAGPKEMFDRFSNIRRMPIMNW